MPSLTNCRDKFYRKFCTIEQFCKCKEFTPNTSVLYLELSDLFVKWHILSTGIYLNGQNLSAFIFQDSDDNGVKESWTTVLKHMCTN